MGVILWSLLFGALYGHPGCLMGKCGHGSASHASHDGRSRCPYLNKLTSATPAPQGISSYMPTSTPAFATPKTNLFYPNTPYNFNTLTSTPNIPPSYNFSPYWSVPSGGYYAAPSNSIFTDFMYDKVTIPTMNLFPQTSFFPQSTFLDNNVIKPLNSKAVEVSYSAENILKLVISKTQIEELLKKQAPTELKITFTPDTENTGKLKIDYKFSVLTTEKAQESFFDRTIGKLQAFGDHFSKNVTNVLSTPSTEKLDGN